MKKFKRKKTSKSNKSRQRKPKVYTVAKKHNSKNESYKDIFRDITIEPSPHKAFIAVIVMKDKKPLKLLQFETDRNAVKAMIELMKVLMSRSMYHVINLHTQLAEILTDVNDPLNDIDTKIENFLACFIESGAVLEEYPDQSIGYILHFHVDDVKKCDLTGNTKAVIEDLFYRIIGDQARIASTRQTA